MQCVSLDSPNFVLLSGHESSSCNVLKPKTVPFISGYATNRGNPKGHTVGMYVPVA